MRVDTLSMLAVQIVADDWRIMATAACCSIACGTIGCFLVLRRMSLLGDAISHAILPGLAIAFILTGTREPLSMLAGALGAGVLTAVLASAVTRWGRVPEDASLGVVFSSFFAIGVILMTWAARQVDLDANCVLYGQLELVALDTVTVGGIAIPRVMGLLLAVLVLNLTVIGMFYKELKIVCFDPALATAMGISAAIVHYGLMVLVAATSVASFEAVGSIMVVTMLVAPGAAAGLLTDRLRTMLVLSGVLALVAAVAGYLLAVVLDTSVAGMVSTVAGGLFVLSALLAPRHGIIGRAAIRAGLALRIAREDILALLYRRSEGLSDSVAGTADRLTDGAAGQRLLRAWAMRSLVRRGLVDGPRSSLRLTEPGRSEAARIVRSHRLWESYLAERLDVPPDHVHEPAERVEHFITPGLQAALEREAPSASDPHGRAIPPVDGAS